MAYAGPKIQVRNLWKIFGNLSGEAAALLAGNPEAAVEDLPLDGCTAAVRAVDFHVNEGEIFVIMGLSGSGKSTLLRCLNGIIEPTCGEVLIDGERVGAMTPKRLRALRQQKMAMVFQHFALLPYRSVLDNVAFGLELQGVGKKERRRRAREVLELVGLAGWEKNLPAELSGGMQQRVGLARALAVDPEILLMDEAFSALDPLIRRQMQDEFLKLVEIVKKTIVFITHDLDEALRLADRIAVMKEGRIVQIGTPEQIVMDPADDYVEEFVGAVSRTRVIAARNIMAEPRHWISPQDRDPRELLRHMDRHNLECVFVTDTARRLVGVLTREELAGQGRPPRDAEPSGRSARVPAVPPDAPLSEVVERAAATSKPIPVLDESGRILGVISRSRLLRELSHGLKA